MKQGWRPTYTNRPPACRQRATSAKTAEKSSMSVWIYGGTATPIEPERTGCNGKSRISICRVHVLAKVVRMSPAPTHPSGDGPSVIRTEVDDLTTRLGELAGHIHAATAELVGLLGRLDEIGGWCDPGIRSLGHWASIYLGIDVRTATEQAQVGRQLHELPAIAAAAAAGELGWSKLRLLGRVAEPDTDQKWLDIARDLSVSQLGRVVGAYRC